jgi:hypothetical protein
MPQIQIGKQPVSQITIIEAEPEKQASEVASWRASRDSFPSACIAVSMGAAS